MLSSIETGAFQDVETAETTELEQENGSTAAEPANENQVLETLPSSTESAGTLTESGNETPGPHRAYLKSFGSRVSITIVLGTELAYIALDRASGK